MMPFSTSLEGRQLSNVSFSLFFSFYPHSFKDGVHSFALSHILLLTHQNLNQLTGVNGCVVSSGSGRFFQGFDYNMTKEGS